MMKNYWTFIGLLLLLFLIIFGVAEQLHLPIMSESLEWMQTGNLSAALIGILLLTIDVILPIPSSFIMIANGALFGIAIGTLLSLIGSLGAALSGFWLGRYGKSWLARVVSLQQQQQADALLKKWGLLAIILTRPLPLLAETTAVVAGTSSLKWSSVALAALAGSIPAAFIYAITGSTAANLNQTSLSFGLVLLIAGLFWGLNRYFNRVLLQRTANK
ncbi:TVP38/TMEM64 family protein [Oculatella sp. LEGE 06141]|uniref:TVP38/TMEM64 family protein n=1 Tax=Oculatella sp. LEGE 06141 TaxID=1828648 RepID=UPI00187E3702|nr:VTT domain-containing protein [Oculatella sp. LEGE 06141]MBE9181449.1 TVP38/TMEM64 family protein [Oculatella sp. LEGE 06141]